MFKAYKNSTSKKVTIQPSVQGPRRDSGSVGTKKVLDALENDTKANFQENILGKVRFQKKWEGAWLCLLFVMSDTVET